MPKQNQNRQWVSTRARAAVAEAHRRRHRRRRLMAAIAAGLLLFALLGGALLATRSSDKAQTVTPLSFSDNPSTTTTPATQPPSVAGQPCVAVADPLPPGAPAVPVPVGPPPTALVTQDLVPGTGADVLPEAKVTVNYIGVSCSTGKIFDSSYARGQTFTADLSPTSTQPVIPGWQQGIPGMKVGGQRLLGIPPDLAYGSTSPSPDIGPDETLWFVVEVVSSP